MNEDCVFDWILKNKFVENNVLKNSVWLIVMCVLKDWKIDYLQLKVGDVCYVQKFNIQQYHHLVIIYLILDYTGEILVFNFTGLV